MVSPFGNVPAGAGPCCARVELSGWAVLHPLHCGMQTPIPVSQRLPLSSPVNTDIFLKSGAPPAQRCSRSKTSWASPVTSGPLQKSQWPPPSLAWFKRAAGVPAAGAGGFFQREEAGWERGGETGAAAGRGGCDATRPSPPCRRDRGAPRQRARRDVRGVGVGTLEFELLSGLDGSWGRGFKMHWCRLKCLTSTKPHLST